MHHLIKTDLFLKLIHYSNWLYPYFVSFHVFDILGSNLSILFSSLSRFSFFLSFSIVVVQQETIVFCTGLNWSLFLEVLLACAVYSLSWIVLLQFLKLLGLPSSMVITCLVLTCPLTSEELLLQEDSSEMSNLTCEFSKGMHLGQAVASQEPFTGVRRPNQISNLNPSMSQR